MASAFADWEYRPPRWRRWAARVLALAALAGCVYGVYAIVRSDATGAGDAPASSPVDAQLAALATAAGRLGDRLGALRPGRSPRRARAAQSQAVDDVRTASRTLAARTTDSPTGDDARLANALDAERELLNAVGATLADPASRLRFKLDARAGRARRALAALPDPAGLPATVRGITRLKSWARAGR